MCVRQSQDFPGQRALWAVGPLGELDAPRLSSEGLFGYRRDHGILGARRDAKACRQILLRIAMLPAAALARSGHLRQLHREQRQSAAPARSRR